MFGVTNFWEDPPNGYENEVRQGKNIALAAKNKGVQHFVWSSLEHTSLKIPHWESKAVVADFLHTLQVRNISCFFSLSTQLSNGRSGSDNIAANRFLLRELPHLLPS